MATHSSVLAWRIPGTAEPGGRAAVSGVAQSWTRLKQFSSSSKYKTLGIYFFSLLSRVFFSDLCSLNLPERVHFTFIEIILSFCPHNTLVNIIN